MNITLEHIIAKIDNDFNPDNSDWIARVPAWCVDAMSQLKVLRTEYKTRKLNVENRIAHSPCPITNSKGFAVYDRNGCEIKSLAYNKKHAQCCSSSTGGRDNMNNEMLSPSDTIYLTDTSADRTHYQAVAEHVNTDDFNKRHTIADQFISPVEDRRNYIIVDNNTIELNFDTDFVTIRNLEIATEHSDYFNGEIPVVPNNGLLIEALAYYCMYKMLTRGMKHPVFNLAASQYGTNPYYMWMQLKDKAKASVIADNQGVNGYDGDAWRAYFYNYTFPK